jgi:hypothetical protein
MSGPLAGRQSKSLYEQARSPGVRTFCLCKKKVRGIAGHAICAQWRPSAAFQRPLRENMTLTECTFNVPLWAVMESG